MGRRGTRTLTTAAGGVALLLAGSLLATPGVAAPADPRPAPSSPPRHSSDLPGGPRTLIDPRVADADVASFRIPRTAHPVGPGLQLRTFDQYDARGWFRAQVLTANLGNKNLMLDHIGAAKVSNRAPLRRIANRRKAVAAVNADFFDIGDTGAALGIAQERRRGLLQARASGWNDVFLVNRRNQAQIAQTFLRGRVIRGNGGPLRVTHLNSPTVQHNQIGIYTPAWGRVARTRVVDNARNVREVVLRGGRVVANRPRLSGAGPVRKGTVVLVGRGTGANRLRALRVGTNARVRYRLSRPARVAVSGSEQLLRNGNVITRDDGPMHPRTAIGVDRSNGRVIVLTVDGRQAHSRGLTLVETARLLRSLGADDALNLDGGGSSTMMARQPGRASRVVNSPSDGRLRQVPNGLGFTVRNSRGKLKSIRIEGVSGPLRVFPGLSRVVRAVGHDARLGPAPLRNPRWTSGARVAKGSGNAAVVTGTTPGRHPVRVRGGGAKGAEPVTVLGALARIDTDRSAVTVPRNGTAYVTVHGYDAAGATAPIDPRDVSFSSSNPALLTVSRIADGRIALRSRGNNGSAAVTMTVAGKRAVVGASVGGAAFPPAAVHDTSGPWTSPIQVAPGAASGFRIAVLAGSLVAGEGARANALRAGLQQAVGAGANLVVGAGDLAADGAPAQLNRVRDIVTDELGGTPFRLYPGAAENSNISAVQSIYGQPTNPANTVNGARILGVNTGVGNFRTTSFNRLNILRDQLATAAADASVRRVVVIGHHPVISLSHGPALTDVRESTLVLQLLEQFRRTSGKQIAYVSARGGRFFALRHEGVDLINIGAVHGVSAAGTADGYVGIGMLGIADNGELRVEFRPVP